MIRERVAFAQPILSKLLMLGIKARTIWLTFLVGVLAGCALMFVWVVVLTVVPETAVALLSEVTQ